MHEEQQIPIAMCGCGFWAYWADQASVSLNNKTAVSGIMEGWGKLIVGPFGFRAQYARIVALCPPAEYKYKTLSLNLAAMRAQYPGVKWYGSYGEMITAHPTPNAFTQLKLDAPDQFYD
jgi:hypothetical protein